jgi:hypothetical protein
LPESSIGTRSTGSIAVPGKSVRLGTFSLFPPDNPGTFIVPDAQVRVGIGKISLTAG